MQIKERDIRILIFRAFVVAAFALLALQSWRLQIVQGEQYREQSERNRFRLRALDAARGVIYDRNGRLLAGNVPSFAVSIVPADLPDEEEEYVFQRLSTLLDIPVSVDDLETGNVPFAERHPPAGEGEYEPEPQMMERVHAGRATPLIPVRVKSDVPRDIAFIIEEERLELPGVFVETEPLREYISSTLASHVVGYVGHIPEQEVETYLSLPDADYDANDIVGLTGVELTLEDQLRGRKGHRHVEVDVTGREIRTIGTPVEPVPGHNLVLTIDVNLQEVADGALRTGLAAAGSESGAVAAMDPRTGEVLALVSLPSYDNNLFIGGISAEEYARLSEDPRHPLVNHAISGQYPPGSTFKIVTAAAGLEEGIVDRYSLLYCPGTIWIPHRFAPEDPDLAQPFKCWATAGHRALNIVSALVQSCDIYFGELAGGYGEFEGLGHEALADYATLFGLGRPTGIDLPGESSGLVPDATWKRLTYGETWVTGDTYNAAIGQGFILATPLQMLNATATIANGGNLYKPQIIREIRDAGGNVVRPFAPHLIRTLPLSDETVRIIGEGLLGAVAYGTGGEARLPGVAVAGKTGSAEYPGQRDWEGNLPTHAWFTAFAPFDDPQIALVVFIEGGGEGGLVAAPVAAQILSYYFNVPLPE